MGYNSWVYQPPLCKVSGNRYCRFCGIQQQLIFFIVEIVLVIVNIILNDSMYNVLRLGGRARENFIS